MLLITYGPDDVDPREEYDPWSTCYVTRWQRTGEPPPPPKLPPSRRPTVTRPGPRWQRATNEPKRSWLDEWHEWRRGWLDTDMESWTP